jgi:hypothetical protein
MTEQKPARKPRDRSRERALRTLPTKYEPNFLERMDARFAIARVIRERVASIESDMGGTETLSHARRSLARRAAWLEAIIESDEQRLAFGAQIDVGVHTQALNSLLGIFRHLGLDRRQKSVRRLDTTRVSVLPGGSAA